MNFKPDPNKQAQETSRKRTASLRPVAHFITDQLNQLKYANIMGWYLIQIWVMSIILNHFMIKTIGILRKIHLILPRHSLITIYKTFINPHLDYGDVMCVCVCACVRACVRTFTVKALSVWMIWTPKEQINNVVLKMFIFYAKYLHRYIRMKHLTFLTSHFILFTH